MRSPYHNLSPPFHLPSNIVYFHDWRYVNPGAFAWRGAAGETVPMMEPGPVPAMKYDYFNMPLGIRLEAQPAQKSGQVLHASDVGDAGMFGGEVIHEDGVYRLWHEAWTQKDFDTKRAGTFNALRYAESTDGLKWKFPRVGPRKLDGQKYQSIVYGSDLATKAGFHGHCVFKDPSASKAERYKLFHLGKVDAAALAAYRKKRPRDLDPFSHHGSPSSAWGLFGATSPDGFRWKPIREPLLVLHSDTHNVCEYDPVLRKYVAYVRTWFFHRRSIGRCMADDFRRFEPAEEVYWPQPDQAPHDTWYCNGKTRMPDALGGDYHVMFPMRWSLPTDHFEFHLATSPDNLLWNPVPGGAVCKPGEPGEWDGGVVDPGVGLVNLPGDRMGIIYGGTPVPHKHPRRPPFGGIGWATWRRGRLVALKCPLEGSFALWPLRFEGRGAYLNVRTALAGYVQVEALLEGKALPGRSFEDCDHLTGDHLDRPITWRGQSDLGHPEGAAVELRFRLRNADLFSVRFD